MPRDTTVIVFGVPFSAAFCEFAVTFNNLPPGLTAECDEPSCAWSISHDPGVVSRGCITISGTPTDTVPDDTLRAGVVITPGIIDSTNMNFCDTDSLMQTAGMLWPLIQGLLTQTASIGLYIDGNVSIEDDLREEMQLSIAPNPTQNEAYLRFNMQQNREVAIEIYDIMGRKIQEVQPEASLIGQQEIRLETSQLNAGLYFVRLNINQGEAVLSEKLQILR